MTDEKINSVDLNLLDSVVKKLGIKLVVEYFGAANWVGEDCEDDTRSLIENFAANIAKDALQLIEKTENGEFEEISQMVFDLTQRNEPETFKNVIGKFVNSNLPDITQLNV